jgi:hypothetical protein
VNVKAGKAKITESMVLPKVKQCLINVSTTNYVIEYPEE